MLPALMFHKEMALYSFLFMFHLSNFSMPCFILVSFDTDHVTGLRIDWNNKFGNTDGFPAVVNNFIFSIRLCPQHNWPYKITQTNTSACLKRLHIDSITELMSQLTAIIIQNMLICITNATGVKTLSCSTR